jgi:hypothetical protein
MALAATACLKTGDSGRFRPHPSRNLSLRQTRATPRLEQFVQQGEGFPLGLVLRAHSGLLKHLLDHLCVRQHQR